MAVITKTQLENASLDADTLGEAVNEDKDIVSRLGASYPSVPRVTRLGNELIESLTDDATGYVAEAKTARDIAQSFASDIVSQGNVPIYATIGAISLVEVPVGITAVRVNGRDVPGDSWGGMFIDRNNGSTETFESGDGRTWYRSTNEHRLATEAEAKELDETDASLVGMMTPLRTIQAIRHGIREHGFITPIMFGADRQGGRNTAPELNAAVAAARDFDTPLYLSAGKYRTTAPVIVTERVTIRGAGQRNATIISEYDGEGALVILPPTSGGGDRRNDINAYYDFCDFGVEPKSKNGLAAIYAYLGTGAYMAQFRVDRVFCRESRGPAIMLDNSEANYNGFFTFEICNSWLEGGIKGRNVGDSIDIYRNQLVFGAPGTCGVDFSGTSGAHQTVIQSNNIVTTGGAVSLNAVERFSLFNNQMEHPQYLRDYDGVYNAAVAIMNCPYGNIDHNTITPGNPNGSLYGLLFDGTTRDVGFGDNVMSLGRAGTHYTIASTCRNIANTGRNTFNTTEAFSDEGRGTMGVRKTIPLTAGYSPGSYGAPQFIKDVFGRVSLDGCISHPELGEAVATLPLGFRPATTRRFRLLQGLNGLVTMQIDPTGLISIVDGAQRADINLQGVSFPSVS